MVDLVIVVFFTLVGIVCSVTGIPMFITGVRAHADTTVIISLLLIFMAIASFGLVLFR